MIAFAFGSLDHPVLFLVVTLIFFMMRSIGGDPFRHGPLLGLNAQGGWVKYGDYQPPAIRRNLAERYGLDLPWHEQYLNFLQGVVTFDYGPSLSFRNVQVNDILKEQGRARSPSACWRSCGRSVWACRSGCSQRSARTPSSTSAYAFSRTSASRCRTS